MTLAFQKLLIRFVPDSARRICPMCCARIVPKRLWVALTTPPTDLANRAILTVSREQSGRHSEGQLTGLPCGAFLGHALGTWGRGSRGPADAVGETLGSAAPPARPVAAADSCIAVEQGRPHKPADLQSKLPAFQPATVNDVDVELCVEICQQ